MPVNFLVIGHISHDRVPAGFRLGGTVSYAAVTARRLGWQPGMLTRATLGGLAPCAADDGCGNATGLPDSPLEGIPICLLPCTLSTTFYNIYRDGSRTQVLESLADPIGPETLPPAWASAQVVLLGPVAREVPPDWSQAFPKALVGITPQGWMRQWNAAGHVRPAPWENADGFLQRADAVIFSREDVGGDDLFIAHLARRARLLVVTDGWRGATLYQEGLSYHVSPRASQEVDPTGAGDVFAAAFLIRLAETGDPLDSVRFANVAASLSVEADGMAAIPYRQRIEDWLRAEPPRAAI